MPKASQTPTQAVTLPYKKSKGNEAVELYNKTGRTCQNWQKKQLKNILAVNKDGLWVHTKYGYSVPRRNGKNEIVVMREIYGLLNGERICNIELVSSVSKLAQDRRDCKAMRFGVGVSIKNRYHFP